MIAACATRQPDDPVHLASALRGGRPILTVVTAPGYRVNARVPPAFELAAGPVIRLDRGRVSPDSFFAEPPWAPEPRDVPRRGTLRASVCRTDESLCRSAVLSVDLRD